MDEEKIKKLVKAISSVELLRENTKKVFVEVVDWSEKKISTRNTYIYTDNTTETREENYYIPLLEAVNGDSR